MTGWVGLAASVSTGAVGEGVGGFGASTVAEFVVAGAHALNQAVVRARRNRAAVVAAGCVFTVNSFQSFEMGLAA
jgi:hypothetical protein